MTLDDVAQVASANLVQPIREYSTFDFGRERNEQARSFIVPARGAKRLLAAVRAQIPPGFIAFIGTSRFLGDEQYEGQVELVLASGEDQFDMLRVARSDACNYMLGTEDIIEQLKKFHGQFGIDIIHAETDTIEFNRLRDPTDIPAFCAALYDLCPDIVDQGVGTPEALEEAVRSSSRVFLWWD